MLLVTIHSLKGSVMRVQHVHRFVFGLLLASLLFSSAAPLFAAEDPKAGSKEKRPGGSGLEAAGRFLRQMTSFRTSSNERNHTKVRAAFREVVREPSLSTVRVYSDGEQIALGAIISPDGYVLTKASELHGTLKCGLASGDRKSAEFIGHHRGSDLALLKIDADSLRPFELHDSAPPAVGSWLITTDIKGGPAAIGVVSVKPRPIKSDPALLGVQLRDADEGPQVTFVMPDSAAQEAGVKINDLVTHLNGKAMKSQRQLVETIRTFMPGERIRLTIKRGDSVKTLRPTLGSFASVNRRQHVQNNLGGPKLSKRNKGFPAALQHDTALPPYQCGGPLIDLDGRLVGINIAHADRVSSLALPTSVILPLLEDLKSGKLRPKPTSTDDQLALKTRAEELRQIVGTWTEKLTHIQESLQASTTAEAKALEAAKKDAKSAETAKLVEEAKAAKKKLEVAFQEAKNKLDEFTLELKQVESKVAMQTN